MNKNIAEIIDALTAHEDTSSIQVLEELGTNSPDNEIREYTSRALVKKNLHDSLKVVIINQGKGINDLSPAVAIININEILYIGDSITDVEPLRFAREHDGISISFNGNDYPLREAQIAIVSPSAIATAVIANIYANYDKKAVLTFIDDYNNSDNIKKLFEDYKIDSQINEEFFRIFKNIKYPLIKIVDSDNFEDILKESIEMRNRIRGEDVGGLG